jgi:hypothetical protein
LTLVVILSLTIETVNIHSYNSEYAHEALADEALRGALELAIGRSACEKANPLELNVGTGISMKITVETKVSAPIEEVWRATHPIEQQRQVWQSISNNFAKHVEAKAK